MQVTSPPQTVGVTVMVWLTFCLTEQLSGAVSQAAFQSHIKPFISNKGLGTLWHTVHLTLLATSLLYVLHSTIQSVQPYSHYYYCK